MSNNIELETIYNLNHGVIHTNLKGISQEESIKPSGDGGTSINWILGHLILTRDSIFQILGVDKMFPENLKPIYSRGTKNVTAENAEKLETLLQLLDKTQEVLKSEIEMSLDEEKRKNVAFFGFHESYHAGQLGIMRRVVGKEGSIK
jgi:uncharacterized damage-inducible protein DinB